MNKVRSNNTFPLKLAIVSGVSGLLASLLLLPPLFDFLFSAGQILEVEKHQLIVFMSIWSVTSFLFVFLRNKVSAIWSFSFLTINLIILFELVFRLIVYSFASHIEHRHEVISNRTYDEFTAFKGHPYLLFTGRPSTEFEGNENLGKLSAFNNYGFVGKDFRHEKEVGVIRIAAIGGSTTISGYPAKLEDFLNDRSTQKFEVLNFGMTFWNSANSLTNFILNVVDFQPDIVIFHHGWNDGKARNYPPEVFRNDYSHVMTYFHEPEIPDRWPLRCSAVYREIRDQLGIRGDWEYLQSSTVNDNKPDVEESFENKKELYPFERNLETIATLCEAKGIQLILLTQPRSTDPAASFSYSAPAIDQANEITRDVHVKFPSTILADLDKKVTGNYNNLFIDLGHFNEKGIRMKAEFVAEHIPNKEVPVSEQDSTSTLPTK